jgi:ferritin-like metal-binding protein YciE
MPTNKFYKLYLDQLKDIYSAENQLVRALPKLAKGASSSALQEAFTLHWEETKGHVQRLEQIFADINASTRGPKCKGMEGLVEEGAELLEKKGKFDNEVLDAGLIAAAQRVEHYEMAAYGTARTFAQQLGYAEAAKLLQQTLDEEHATDQKLTAIAMGEVNQEAQAQ